MHLICGGHDILHAFYYTAFCEIVNGKLGAGPRPCTKNTPGGENLSGVKTFYGFL
jgi:hypothetical protein